MMRLFGAALRELAQHLSDACAREEELTHLKALTKYPMVLNAGDTLHCNGLVRPISHYTVFRNERELDAYLRPYFLLRSLKG